MLSRPVVHATFAVIAAVVAISVADAQMSLPRLKRQPVNGTPVICGAKISQFVLLEPVDFTPDDHFSMDPIQGFRKNLFQPVSEDAHGVFYQAANGVIIGRPNPPHEHRVARGGIYVSKTKPGPVYGYLGNARDQQAELTMMSARLPKPALEKLRIGAPATGKK